MNWLNQIHQGDSLEILRQIPSDYVDTIITSPPYWKLRDYGIGGQLGLEETLEEYTNKLLEITKELKRVLKNTGILYWNHGDCYGGNLSAPNQPKLGKRDPYKDFPIVRKRSLIPKCLIGQNYRLILRMVDEQQWIWRNTIIWHKPNHMPSSVKDRFTNAYEPIFMLVKNKKYWFDLDAVRKQIKTNENRPYGIIREREFGYNTEYPQIRQRKKKDVGKPFVKGGRRDSHGFIQDWAIEKYGSDEKYRKHLAIKGKNPSDVWRIPTQPFPDAHFATFPEKLIEPMILSSCPAEICKKCGKVRVRIVKSHRPKDYDPSIIDKKYQEHCRKSSGQKGTNRPISKIFKDTLRSSRETLGWTNCNCNAGFKSGIALDPFIGSGTTALVALKLQRNFIGIDLKKEYVDMANKRIEYYLRQQRLKI